MGQSLAFGSYWKGRMLLVWNGMLFEQENCMATSYEGTVMGMERGIGVLFSCLDGPASCAYGLRTCARNHHT